MVTQNLWKNKGRWHNRQVRRSQLVQKLLQGCKQTLDLGCGEGFTTRYIAEVSGSVVGIDQDATALTMARQHVPNARFIEGSIVKLDFSDHIFDSACVLEVMEHLPYEVQQKVSEEIDRVLQPGGILIVSVPYKEDREFSTCIHCHQATPHYGHLHSLDVNDVSRLFQSFKLLETHHIVNMELISCSRLFSWMPFSLWINANRLLGRIRSGYWIVMKFTKPVLGSIS